MQSTYAEMSGLDPTRDPTADFFDESDEGMQKLLANARLSEARQEGVAQHAVAPVRQQHEEPLELLDVEEVSGEVATVSADAAAAQEDADEEAEDEDWEAAALRTVSVQCPEAAGLNDVAKLFKGAGTVENAYRVGGREVRVQFSTADGVAAAKALSGAELCGGIILVEQ